MQLMTDTLDQVHRRAHHLELIRASLPLLSQVTALFQEASQVAGNVYARRRLGSLAAKFAVIDRKIANLAVALDESSHA